MSSEFNYKASPHVRQTVIHPALGFGGASASVGGWRVSAYSTSPTEGFVLQSDVNYARALVDLSALVPSGSRIVRVRAAVLPGSARSTSNRMTLALARLTVDLGTAAISYSGPLHSDEDSGAAAAQLLDTGTIDEAASRSGDEGNGDGATALLAVITAGNDAGTNRDQLRALVIDWHDYHAHGF